MKSLIYALSLLAFLSFGNSSSAWNTAVMSGGGAVAGGVDYSDIIFFWRGEGTTLGSDDCYGSDSTALANGDIAITAAAAKSGTNGIDVDDSSTNGGDYYEFDVSSVDIIDDEEGRIGFWYRFANANSHHLFRAYTDSNNFFAARITSSGDGIYFKWKDGGTLRSEAYNTNTSLDSTGTWYFVELAWKVSTDYRSAFVDGTEYTLTNGGTTIGSLTGDVAKLQIGNTDSTTGEDSHYDLWMVSNDSTRDFNADCGEGTACKDLTACPN